MSKLLPSYLFSCSMAVLLLYWYPLDFIALSSFYFLLAIYLFSLLCGLFVVKILGWHWLLKIVLWSGGAVNLRIRFWPALWHNFWLIFRAEYLGFLWLNSYEFELGMIMVQWTDGSNWVTQFVVQLTHTLNWTEWTAVQFESTRFELVRIELNRTELNWTELSWTMIY